MDASKTDINRWEVVVNGEGHVMREGCTIVTMDLIANKKNRRINRFPILFDLIVFPFFHVGVIPMCQ